MTTLSDIYDSFLSKIADYNLASLVDTDLKDELFGYFKPARAKFYKCKKVLDLKDDSLTFVEELSDYEIEIIVQLMLVEYMKPLILTSEITKQALSDKDFKIWSQANHLRELNLLYRLFQKEAEKMITKYLYMELTDK